MRRLWELFDMSDRRDRSISRISPCGTRVTLAPTHSTSVSMSPPAADQQAPLGQRNTREIPQDVKIQVAARDGGRCRQCGSTQDLHFDHVIPWSKGGANTVRVIHMIIYSKLIKL